MTATDIATAYRRFAEACDGAAAAVRGFNAEWQRWWDSLTDAERAEWNSLAFPAGDSEELA